MAATAPVFPLSQVTTLDTSYLRGAADYWDRTANLWEESFTDVHRRVSAPGGTPWTGFGNEGAQQRTYADMVKVRTPADQLRHVSGVARRGDEALQFCKQGVLSAVREARDDGFDVGEDYSVTDRTQGGSSAYRGARQTAAQGHATFIRHKVAALVAKDNEVAMQIAVASESLDKVVFDEKPVESTPAKDGIQLVGNRRFKDAPAPKPEPNPRIDKAPDPVGKLGLPNYNPGSLSAEETRTVYTQGELRMRELNEQLAEQGLSTEERAKIMFEQRNALRSWTRDLMSNRALADQLNATEPNLTFGDLVAKNQAKGVTGDDLYRAIIESSIRSRGSVNAGLGIDPAHPPPLPPIRPTDPIGGAPTAPVISPLPNQPTVLAHPPTEIRPPEFTHPPVAPPPPTVLDHPPLPPWLQDPSPPGFQISPNQSAPIFGWDTPNPSDVPLPAPGPSSAPITLPSPPSPPLITPEEAKAGGLLAGAGGVGLWIITQLGKLAHPFSP
jgi:hypothetical protein